MSASVSAPERPLTHVYDAAYTGVPNWDIGRPQRAFVRLAETGRFEGPILEVGCGTGELSLFLARQGYDVLGIDLSSVAISQANKKSSLAPSFCTVSRLGCTGSPRTEECRIFVSYGRRFSDVPYSRRSGARSIHR
ncbi:class I SAM-dependent methyltransferase [Haladaptatus sp. DYF46]|uniref:class I SAM-dependent methyltransferase n=1 Tax=Haladaptatus sp. DYF46 TaxID=2886041 RepID=UPI001E588E3E